MTLTRSDLTISAVGLTVSDMDAMDRRDRIPRSDSSRIRSMRTLATSGVWIVGRMSNRISLVLHKTTYTDTQTYRQTYTQTETSSNQTYYVIELSVPSKSITVIPRNFLTAMDVGLNWFTARQRAHIVSAIVNVDVLVYTKNFNE